MVASSGTVKKTKLTEFSRPRASGILAVDLRENDRLIGVEITDGNTDILLVGETGKAIRFKEDDVRAMGRNATGVRGIKLAEDQQVVSLLPLKKI